MSSLEGGLFAISNTCLCCGKPAQDSKHKTFVQHLYNVGPSSSTLVQHCTNVVQMLCVNWEDNPPDSSPAAVISIGHVSIFVSLIYFL